MLDIDGHFGWGNTTAIFFVVGMSRIQERTSAGKRIKLKSKKASFGPRLGLGSKWQFARSWIASCQFAGSFHSFAKVLQIDSRRFSTMSINGYAIALRWDISLGVGWVF